MTGGGSAAVRCRPAGSAGVRRARPDGLGVAAAGRCRRAVSVRAGDGLRLAVRDRGDRRAEHTVVFLHGFCLSSTTWAHEIGRLRRRHGERLRVISYDHRGHGRSDAAPGASCRIEQLADDLAVVLDRLAVSGPMTLVGHSMGAMTAIEYAAGGSSRPVVPAGLVLVGAAAGRVAQRGVGRLLATPVIPVLSALARRVPARIVPAVAGPVCAAVGRGVGCGRPERATVSELAASAVVSTPLSTALGFLPSLRDWDRQDALGEIRARTVVVSGGRDVLTPPVHSAEIAAAIPGAVHFHVPGAGHMLPQQVPDTIDEAVNAVIASAGSRVARRCGVRLPAVTAW